MNPWWRWPALGLVVIGWACWALALVALLYCQGLQSGMLAEPGDPCRELTWIVAGGFIFLLFASIFALFPPRRSEHESDENSRRR